MHFRCRQQTSLDIFKLYVFTENHIRPVICRQEKERKKSLSLCNCPRACKVQSHRRKLSFIFVFIIEYASYSLPQLTAVSFLHFMYQEAGQSQLNWQQNLDFY